MLSIARSSDYTIFHKGRKYAVNLAFDIVIKAYEIQADLLLSDLDKADLICYAFIGNNSLNLKSKLEIVNIILDKFVRTNKKVSGKRVIDYEKDSPYLYASFLQAYGIDLMEMQGILPWDKFVALLQSLPENTKMSQIMSIRAQDIPPPTKYNADEIARITKLKQIYSLHDEDSEQDLQDGLEQLFNTLKQRAVK